jgi:hypothetical protein
MAAAGGTRRRQTSFARGEQQKAAWMTPLALDLAPPIASRMQNRRNLPDVFPVWCRLTEPEDPVAGWAAPAGRPPPCGTCAGAGASDFGGSARAAHVTRGDRPAEGARTQAGSGRFCCRPPAPERIQRPGNKISFRGVFVTSSPRPRRVRSPSPFDAAAAAATS